MSGKQKRTALELGRDILESRLDPVDLTIETLEYIEVCEFTDQIFARVTKERAMEEARASRDRQRSGTLQSPLDGVPISWKDLFDTKGLATESGSQLLLGRTPEEDCTALKNATASGLVCVGKTHLSELAFSGLGINPKTATSPNTHGNTMAPGGSSSGAAASVAYRIVPMGIGSDTGGSVRIPSAWNDLVGFKTTHGLISDEGVVPLCRSFDTAGPLCTTVADAWTMVAIMAGLPPKLPEAKPIAQCRFLVNKTITLDAVAEDQLRGFNEAVEKIRQAGATVDEAEIPVFDDILPLGPILFPREAWNEWGDLIDANPGVMFEPVESRFRSGQDITQDAFNQAWIRMMELRKVYNDFTASHDAVLAPTVQIAPPEVAPLLEDFELFGATNMAALRNTRFFNMFGCCALTLPTARPAAGLMLAARGGQDQHLTSVGLSVETVLS